MRQFILQVSTFSSKSCYPENVQDLINLIAENCTLRLPFTPTRYGVSSTVLPQTRQSEVWFQTSSPAVGTTGYGAPKTPRLFRNPSWGEFATLRQGDRILCPVAHAIEAPWGEFGFTYGFGDTGVPNYTPTQAPAAPAEYKYKTYVGYWSTRT